MLSERVDSMSKTALTCVWGVCVCVCVCLVCVCVCVVCTYTVCVCVVGVKGGTQG